MKYAYFIGCHIPAYVSNYDLAARKIAEKLGIELVNLEGAGCCGFLARFIDFKTSILIAARVHALASQKNLEILVLCNGCYGMLNYAAEVLRENSSLLKEANEALAEEGLQYREAPIKHITQVLYHDQGLDKLKAKVKKRFKGLKVAAQYGCHILRPHALDNPETPEILDKLVGITGAESIDWKFKLWCCGAATLYSDAELSLKLGRRKLEGAKKAGAHCFVTVCPLCQIQLDVNQPKISEKSGEKYGLPSLLYPQLLGLSMGLTPKEVGLNLNTVSAEDVLRFLSED